ncbi:MAG TPA: plastocyanin/azurin family copper-binding protein [Ktedonobacterales bacterium]
MSRRSAGLWAGVIVTATVVLMVALAVMEAVSWGVAVGLIAGVVFTLALLYIFFGRLNSVQKTGYASLLGVVLIALFIPLFWLSQNSSQASFQADTYQQTLKRGAALYGTYCIQCHGATGQGGTGPTLNTPSSTDAKSPTVNNLTDDDLTRIISAGVPASPLDLSNQGLSMPAWSELYGGPLTADDISYLVALIRSSDPTYLKTNHQNDMTNGFTYVYGQLTTQAQIDVFNQYCAEPSQNRTHCSPPSSFGEEVDMTKSNQIAMKIVNGGPAGWGFEFTNIKIKVGTTVTWTNVSSAQHTVTSGTPNKPDGIFDSGTTNFLQPNDQGASSVFSHTFDTPGSFTYYCIIHPGMIAKITVVSG